MSEPPNRIIREIWEKEIESQELAPIEFARNPCEEVLPADVFYQLEFRTSAGRPWHTGTERFDTLAEAEECRDERNMVVQWRIVQIVKTEVPGTWRSGK